MALFTVVITVVSIYQWRATREATEIGQRAWVVPTEVKVKFSPDGTISFAARIDNIGNGPAVIIGSKTEVFLMKADVPLARREVDPISDDLLQNPQSGKSIIGARQNVTWTYSDFIGPEHRQMVRTKEGILYMSIWIRYRDWFAVRRTKTCHVFNPGRSVFVACTDPDATAFD
jgi:hypothetical protein